MNWAGLSRSQEVRLSQMPRTSGQKKKTRRPMVAGRRKSTARRVASRRGRWDKSFTGALIMTTCGVAGESTAAAPPVGDAHSPAEEPTELRWRTVHRRRGREPPDAR